MKLVNKNFPMEELIISGYSLLYYIYGNDEQVDEILKNRQDELDKISEFFGGNQYKRDALYYNERDIFTRPGILLHQKFIIFAQLTQLVLYVLNNGWEIVEL